MKNLLETLRSLGPARLAAMVAVGIGLVAFFAYLATRLPGGDMAVLYADLPRGDGAAMVGKLDQMKVPYEISPDGGTIKVPSDQVGHVRMALAAEGLPNGGTVGYELFDQTQAFGTTSFVQSINHVRALEGELARTIGTLAPVRAARIHLVLPKRELFSRDEQPATASVIVQLRPGAQLSHEQVASIQHLVAAAVPQLKAGQVSIVDDKGALLARGGDGDAVGAAVLAAEELRHATEHRLSATVEELVGRTVGQGRVRATVNADYDMDRVTVSQETFDPQGQVARSTSTVEDKNESQDSQRNEQVSVAANVPGGTPSSGGSQTQNKGNRTEETTNYEIGKTVRNQVREGAQLKRLSVAVMVDGVTTPGAEGQPASWAPRASEEMKQIEQLVKTAVGFDQQRGDVVQVTTMRFVADPLATVEEAPAGPFGLTRGDIVRLVETAVLAVVALLVILLVVKPVLTKMLATPRAGVPGLPAPAGTAMLAEPGHVPAQLSGPTGSALAQSMQAQLEGHDELDRMIDLDQVDGRVRASSLRKIGDIVEKHPSEAVSILRGWMYQET